MRRQRLVGASGAAFASAIVGALSLAIAACALVAGIGDDDLTVAAGVTSDAGDAAPGCRHVDPPTAPDAEDPGGDLYVFAVKSFDFKGVDEAGVRLGFDLDRSCTCDPEESRQRSCRPPAGAKETESCDIDGGIDNAGAPLIERVTVGSTAFQATLSESTIEDLNCGRIGMLFIVTGYNGLANDPHVELAAIDSYGILDRPARGEVDAGCFLGGPRVDPFYAARWDGADRWSVPKNHVGDRTGGKAAPTVNLASGWVRDFQLVVDVRPVVLAGSAVATTWPLLFGGRIISVGTPVLSGTLVPVDDNGRDIAIVDGIIQGHAQAFRLANTTFAGRMDANDVLSTIGGARVAPDSPIGGAGEYLCATGPLAYEPIKATLCRSTDVMANGGDDFRDLPCNGLSVVMRLEAVPALVGRDYDPTIVESDGGCNAQWRDSCSAR